jgi:hypothetical protein
MTMCATVKKNDSRLLGSGLVIGITSLFLLLAGAVFGQQDRVASFGVKGGANWSNLWIKEAHDNNARLGFHFGMFGRVAPSDAIGIQLEALYNQKGATYTRRHGPVEQRTTLDFEYIDLPLMLVIPMGNVLELHGGGYLGYMLHSRISHRGDLGSQDITLRTEDFNRLDYGLVGGVGLNIGQAQIGGRYMHGLMDVAGTDGGHVVMQDSKNSVAQVYLAFAIGR